MCRGPSADLFTAGLMRLIAIALLQFGAVAHACEVVPNEVMRRLKAEQPRDVVSKLWDGRNCEKALLSGLSSGKPEWLALAVKLRPHTDAWASESLADALGEAMQKAPSRVLPLIGSGGFDKEICLPWMMDDSGESDNRYRQQIKRARPMFEAFINGKYEASARLCLEQVTQAEHGPLFEKHEP